MGLAKADTRALKQAEDQLYKYGGSGVWTDILTPAVEDDFGNITTPAVLETFNISLLPTKVEDGWINANIATADNKVFLVAAKELSDYGITFDKTETITFNGDTLKIERDEPYNGGQGAVLHRFICSVTT